jgi:hypothetical protein
MQSSMKTIDLKVSHNESKNDTQMIGTSSSGGSRGDDNMTSINNDSIMIRKNGVRGGQKAVTTTTTTVPKQQQETTVSKKKQKKKQDKKQEPLQQQHPELAERDLPSFNSSVGSVQHRRIVQCQKNANPSITEETATKDECYQTTTVLTSNYAKIKREKGKIKTELCLSFDRDGTCQYGDKCRFAHGIEELRQKTRHAKFKEVCCDYYHYHGYCRYGIRCCYIHDIPVYAVGNTVAENIDLLLWKQRKLRLPVFVTVCEEQHKIECLERID